MNRVEPSIVPVPFPHAPEAISHERIALRAYEKWLARGGPENDDGRQDWFAALEEIEFESEAAAQ